MTPEQPWLPDETATGVDEPTWEQEILATPEADGVNRSIGEALRDTKPINHETAFRIARAVSPGDGALEQVVRTGEVSEDIVGDLAIAYELLPGLANTWLAALDGYCLARRRSSGPVGGWPAQEWLQQQD
jgi:hypothetical protein